MGSKRTMTTTETLTVMLVTTTTWRGGTLSVPTAVIGAIIIVAFNIPNYPIRIMALKSVPLKLQCANELLGILK